MLEGSVFVRGSDGRACAAYKGAKDKTRYLYAKGCSTQGSGEEV